MKSLVARVLIALGFLTFFKGTFSHFEANAKEGSTSSSAGRSDTMGGRSGGCGKCN
ncbi:MAG TPA: hypothetical protein VNJ01_01870 [Bacteriovoracaceae bacterium]|nr:hypothetical protein [Bacteriovoracaceae bacterium]